MSRPTLVKKAGRYPLRVKRQLLRLTRAQSAHYPKADVAAKIGTSARGHLQTSFGARRHA